MEYLHHTHPQTLYGCIHPPSHYVVVAFDDPLHLPASSVVFFLMLSLLFLLNLALDLLLLFCGDSAYS